MKKIALTVLCLVLVLSMTIPALADSAVANRITYYYESVDVKGKELTINGYVENRNSDVTITAITDFNMDFYCGGEFIFNAVYKQVNISRIYPNGCVKLTLTVTDGNENMGLPDGHYTFGDTDFIEYSFSFTYKD